MGNLKPSFSILYIEMNSPSFTKIKNKINNFIQESSGMYITLSKYNTRLRLAFSTF